MPHMPRTLVIIDAQNDFIKSDGLLSLFKNKKEESDAFVARLNNFLEKIPKGFFDKALVIRDTHCREYYHRTAEGKKYPLHCDFGTEGWQLVFDVNALKLQDKAEVYFLNKSNFDMWDTNSFSASLVSNDQERCTAQQNLNKVSYNGAFICSMKDFHKEHINGPVYICGVASDVCVKCGIEGFLKRGNKIFVIEDLTKGLEKEIREILPAIAMEVRTSPIRQGNFLLELRAVLNIEDPSIINSAYLLEKFVSEKIEEHEVVGEDCVKESVG